MSNHILVKKTFFLALYLVLENDNFVYMRSRLKLNPEKGNAVWTKIEYGDKIIEVQKFADVGRHFLVDDIDADEVDILLENSQK